MEQAPGKETFSWHMSEEKKDEREDRKCGPKIAKNFEEDSERGLFEFRTQNQTVKMTEERLGRRDLGRESDWTFEQLVVNFGAMNECKCS